MTDPHTPTDANDPIPSDEDPDGLVAGARQVLDELLPPPPPDPDADPDDDEGDA